MKKITIGSKPIAGPGDRPTADQWVSHRLTAQPMKRLTIDLPPALHKRIKSQCAMRGVKMADAVRELLEQQFPDEFQPRAGDEGRAT